MLGSVCSLVRLMYRVGSDFDDPDELGRVYEPDVGIVASLPAFAAELRELGAKEPRWAEWTRAARAASRTAPVTSPAPGTFRSHRSPTTR